MKAIKEELARQIRPFEERAADKVLSIDVMAGTPDNWPIDRSNLKISDDSHADNILRIQRFHQELMVKTMCADCDVSPEALFDYPLNWVNAYFQHQLNTIVINAGIMKPPVFSALYSELGQMARLGVIVGHETGHSIDMTGSLSSIVRAPSIVCSLQKTKSATKTTLSASSISIQREPSLETFTTAPLH